jgi:streptogramin lyase
MKEISTILLCLLLTIKTNAQIGINNSNTPPHISAQLDVSSNNKGILLPRMTSAQKNAIPNKAEGLLVYDSDIKQFSYWMGTLWVNFGSAASVVNGWSISGNNLTNNNSGNVGIGASNPTAKLEINSGLENNSGIRLSQLKEKIIPSKVFYNVSTPSGMAFDNDNNLYITSNIENKIYRILSGGRKSDFVTAGLNLPFGIVIGPDNNLYISNAGGNNILKITPNNIVSEFANGFNFPIGLTFDLEGNLYVVNGGGSSLSKISPAGVVNLNFGTGLNSAEGCVFNPATNKIYVANVGSSEIAQFNTTIGGAKTTFVSGIAGLNDITCDQLGNLFITNTNDNKISKINPNGIKTDYALSNSPSSVVFDKNKQMVMAAYGLNQISRQSANSRTLLSLNDNGDIEPIETTAIDDEHFIGERFGGGIIFSLSDDKKSGLIVANKNQFSTNQFDQSSEMLEGNYLFSLSHVVNPNRHDEDGKKYTDWRLPTIEEFMTLGSSKVISFDGIENFGKYWTSTPSISIPYDMNATELLDVYNCLFCDFPQSRDRKLNTRAVRFFSTKSNY